MARSGHYQQSHALANDTVVSPSLDTGKSVTLCVNSLYLIFLTSKRHPSKISTGIQMVPALVLEPLTAGSL